MAFEICVVASNRRSMSVSNFFASREPFLRAPREHFYNYHIVCGIWLKINLYSSITGFGASFCSFVDANSRFNFSSFSKSSLLTAMLRSSNFKRFRLDQKIPSCNKRIRDLCSWRNECSNPQRRYCKHHTRGSWRGSKIATRFL